MGLFDFSHHDDAANDKPKEDATQDVQGQAPQGMNDATGGMGNSTQDAGQPTGMPGMDMPSSDDAGQDAAPTPGGMPDDDAPVVEAPEVPETPAPTPEAPSAPGVETPEVPPAPEDDKLGQ